MNLVCSTKNEIVDLRAGVSPPPDSILSSSLLPLSALSPPHNLLGFPSYLKDPSVLWQVNQVRLEGKNVMAPRKHPSRLFLLHHSFSSVFFFLPFRTAKKKQPDAKGISAKLCC